MRSIVAVLLPMLLLGCGSTGQQVTHYAFPFWVDDVEYSIISVVVSDDGGHNFLTRRVGGQLVLSAKDEDQNGTLDSVLIGELTLEEANLIYLYGIEQARSSGRYREETDPRLFEFSMAGMEYAVHSFRADTDTHYNTFAFYLPEGEVVFVDHGADGSLDRLKKGQADLRSSQEIYSAVISEGIRQGRILAQDGRFIVQDRPI